MLSEDQIKATQRVLYAEIYAVVTDENQKLFENDETREEAKGKCSFSLTTQQITVLTWSDARYYDKVPGPVSASYKAETCTDKYPQLQLTHEAAQQAKIESYDAVTKFRLTNMLLADSQVYMFPAVGDVQPFALKNPQDAPDFEQYAQLDTEYTDLLEQITSVSEGFAQTQLRFAMSVKYHTEQEIQKARAELANCVQKDDLQTEVQRRCVGETAKQ